MPRVNRTRRRSSGTLLMFAKPASTLIESPREEALAASLRCRGGLRLRDEHGLAARLRDLVLRALGEGVRGDGDLLREVPVAEDLDAVGMALDEAATAEGALVDVRIGVEQLELADVDLGNDRLVVLLEAALRETTREGRLAAFERRLERRA